MKYPIGTTFKNQFGETIGEVILYKAGSYVIHWDDIERDMTYGKWKLSEIIRTCKLTHVLPYNGLPEELFEL